MTPEIENLYHLIEDHERRIGVLRSVLAGCNAEGASFRQLTNTLTHLLQSHTQLCREIHDVLAKCYSSV